EAGWEGLTVSQVAKAAGVSVGAVYDRFTDKDGLIHAIQREVLDELDASLLAAFTELREHSELRVVELLERAVLALVGQLDRYSALIGAFLLRAATDQVLRDRGNSSGGLTENLFAELLLSRRGELTAADPATAVHVAFRAAFTAVMWELMFTRDAGFTTEISREVLVRELLAMFRTYLLGPTTPGSIT
ncbi:MAG TPA: TetR/AcrR family transcriptional regulator, partial [Pseudonocardia sp.]|nr:TetR/AcrR family transcriptional regulator [Pseudonocardia sp.]